MGGKENTNTKKTPGMGPTSTLGFLFSAHPELLGSPLSVHFQAVSLRVHAQEEILRRKHKQKTHSCIVSMLGLVSVPSLLLGFILQNARIAAEGILSGSFPGVRGEICGARGHHSIRFGNPQRRGARANTRASAANETGIVNMLQTHEGPQCSF